MKRMQLALVALGALAVASSTLAAADPIKGREDFRQEQQQVVEIKQEELREEAPAKGARRPLAEAPRAPAPQLPPKGPLPDEWQLPEQQKAELVEQEQQQVVEEERLEPLATKGGKLAPKAPKAEAEPYSFGYQTDSHGRRESGDARGVVRGQYSLVGADGQQRVVDYIADHQGFRATIQTSEFGTEQRSPASVELRSSQPRAEEITRQLEFAQASQAPADRKGGATKQAERQYLPQPARPLPSVVAAPIKGQQQLQQSEELVQQRVEQVVELGERKGRAQYQASSSIQQRPLRQEGTKSR